MASLHQQPVRLVRCVPFPAFLLDDVMPTLTLAEFKLLAVVVRQTIGWRDPVTGQRKVADWMTHAELKRRTGCASEAVSRAIDRLVRRNLIEVTSDTGELLLTPAERRRNAGRLYFRLAAPVLALLSAPEPAPDVPGDNRQEVGITGRMTEVDTSATEAPTSETGLRKAKTTKETPDKMFTPDGGGAASTAPLSAVPMSQDQKNSRSRDSAPNPDVRRFLAAYRALFQRRCPGNHAPPISWGRDGALAKQLLGQYSLDHLISLLDRFFAKDDPWIRRRGYALTAFRTALPQMLIEVAPPPGLTRPRTGQWTRAGSVTVSSNHLDNSRL